jgi:uncharacterized protein YozE (UPF0346 family)
VSLPLAEPFSEIPTQPKLLQVPSVVTLPPLLIGRFHSSSLDSEKINGLDCSFIAAMLSMAVIQTRLPSVKPIFGSNPKKSSHGTELALNIYMTNTSSKTSSWNKLQYAEHNFLFSLSPFLSLWPSFLASLDARIK